MVGNPPYVRQEKLVGIKPYFEKNFRTYTGTADLFVYFIETSLKYLKKDSAYLGIIVSNKWLKRKYGIELRKFLKNFWIEKIVDFGVLQIFSGATTYPGIFVIKNSIKKNPRIQICQIKEYPTNLQKYVEENTKEFPQVLLTDENWDLKESKLLELMERINERTIPFKKIKNNEFYRGVTTGLNEAFVITKDQYDKLIKEDPRSKEIIFPHITGKEVKRHHVNWEGKYLIFTKRGIDIEKFPAIKKHLLMFKEKLTPKKNLNAIGRKPGKYKWFEIQDTTAYWNIFLEEGIVYPDINKKPNFAINDKNYFPNASLYQIKNNDLWLLSILNSNIVNCYLKKVCPDLQGGYYDYKSIYIENIPIPKTKKYEQEIVELTKKITKLKTANGSEYDALEKEINQLIYEEYDLKQNDIDVIERNIE